MQPWQMSPDEFLEEYGRGFSGAEALRQLGGFAAMAGVDPESFVLARKIVDHPMLGRKAIVKYGPPGSSERKLKFAEGKVVKVLTHPRGALLFETDVDTPEFFVPTRLWPEELHAGLVAVALRKGRDVPSRAKRGYTKRLGRVMEPYEEEAWR